MFRGERIVNVGEWICEWAPLHAAKVRPETMRGYLAALDHLTPDFLALDLEHVSPMDWECQVATLAERFPRQAQLLHSALRKCWNDGIRLQVIRPDNKPYLYVEGVKHRPRPIDCLLPEEMPAYARAAMQTPGGFALVLMLCLGLRRGEMLGLSWDEIDTRLQLIHVEHQRVKGKVAPLKTTTSDRKIPVSRDVIDFLYKWGDKDRFFVYNGSARQLYRYHQAALDVAGISAHVTLHGLRHSCATAALAAGADVVTVQHILGHANFSTTADIYCHALLSSERKAIGSVISSVDYVAM